MDSSCPYIIRIEMEDGSQRMVAQATTAAIAIAALRRAATEFPQYRLTLYINGYAAIEEGPMNASQRPTPTASDSTKH